jgi:hypothetical protein
VRDHVNVVITRPIRFSFFKFAVTGAYMALPIRKCRERRLSTSSFESKAYVCAWLFVNKVIPGHLEELPQSSMYMFLREIPLV